MFGFMSESDTFLLRDFVVYTVGVAFSNLLGNIELRFIRHLACSSNHHKYSEIPMYPSLP